MPPSGGQADAMATHESLALAVVAVAALFLLVLGAAAPLAPATVEGRVTCSS